VTVLLQALLVVDVAAIAAVATAVALRGAGRADGRA
jgi:hypothetical protein